VQAENIHNTAIIGAGIMGQGIAQSFAQAGLNVKIVDIDASKLTDCRSQINVNIKQFAEFGLVSEDIQLIESRISYFLMSDLKKAAADSDFFLEAIPEKLELKKELFSQLDAYNTTAILASNTSSFTIDALTDGLKHPENVIGVHYFNPAHIIPLVELHRGQTTTDEVYEETRRLMQLSGKKTVLVRKEVPGFIVNRLTGALEREIDYLLDEGIVTPEDLDIAVKSSIGFRMACLGPQQVEDMIGLDTASRSSTNIFKVLSNRIGPSPSLIEKVKKGELGIKSGKGWYDYSGKTRQEVLNENNRLLLQQLKLYQSRLDTENI